MEGMLLWDHQGTDVTLQSGQERVSDPNEWVDTQVAFKEP